MPVSPYYDLCSSAKSNLRSSAIVHGYLTKLVTNNRRGLACNSLVFSPSGCSKLKIADPLISINIYLSAFLPHFEKALHD